MMRRLPLAVLCLLPALSLAAAKDFAGKWDLTFTQGALTMEGLLEIRETGDGLKGYVEGGPVRLRIDADSIEMGIDDRTAAGMPFERYLRGTLAKGSMSGRFGPENEVGDKIRSLCRKLPLACPAPTGSWRAAPHADVTSAGQSPQPLDLSGTWVVAVPGIRRWSADLTESAKAWKAGFDVKMDLPDLRCASMGLVNGWGFRGNEPEIYQTDTKVTIVLGSEVRRIYLDDRRPPEYADWYPLGFSSGHWEGSTLVVETTNLQPALREWSGEPISENARVVERYSIDEQGRLVGVLTLNDPQYYREAPLKRARWRRADDKAIRFPSLCDPDSFYRQLYDEGKFDEYIRRAGRRF